MPLHKRNEQETKQFPTIDDHIISNNTQQSVSEQSNGLDLK
jgi:hypothetical protein